MMRADVVLAVHARIGLFCAHLAAFGLVGGLMHWLQWKAVRFRSVARA